MKALFVYGTLHPDRAPAEIAGDVRDFRQVGKGSIQGVVRELAEFPAAKISAISTERVNGTVWEIPDDPAVLRRLDDYEEFYPADPAQSLFVRKSVNVTLNDGKRRRCWVYLYNRPFAA